MVSPPKFGINHGSPPSERDSIAAMSGSYRKLFRESHREPRLRTWQPGFDTSFEVRPLTLTPADAKVIRIKDPNQRHHERKD